MMQDKIHSPLVSICIPTYNYAHYLPQAIASCLGQSYPQIELIIVDDASTDDSGQVIKSFEDPRIRFLENPVRLGLVENWNKALSLVRGEIVKFVFADDYLAEDAIERIVAAFDNQDVDLVFCTARVIDAQGNQTYIHQPYSESRHLAGRDEAKRCLLEGNYIGGPSSVAVRTSALERAGEFDETLRFQADQEMWLRILLEGDAYFLVEPLVFVRQHDGSETRRLERTQQTQQETLKFLTSCLQNEQMRALLSESEVSELVERHEGLSIPQSSGEARLRPDGETSGVRAADILNSRVLPRLKRAFRPMFGKPIRTARSYYQKIHGRKEREVSDPPLRNDLDYKVSYSQCGEDLILSFIFDELKLSELTYLDIGAYHPIHFSNTYRFYQQGHWGVCVEPDPVQFARFKQERPRDTCLNVGIGGASHIMHADYYRMNVPTLNTFSKEEATRYESYGNQKIEEVIQVPLIPVNMIMERHFPRCPNFVSLDVEGLDLEILQSFDFSRFRPQAFCVETLTYTEDSSERKITEIVELMQSEGYFAYADTYINTIFVDRESWQNR